MDLSQDYVARFGGIGRLYGVDALARLHGAHVCVVGVGGVGSWTVEALARSGVGRLTLIDLDDICVNNSNRQLHTTEHTVGLQKVDVLADRVRAINPECQVNAISDFFTPETADALLDADFDWVVDAIDHLRNKVLLIAACKARGIKVVVAGGAGGRIDPTQLQVADMTRSGSDGLLRQARRLLRKEHGFSSDESWEIPCIFSRERAIYPTPEGGVCHTAPSGESVRLDCSQGFGAATYVTGTVGFMAAGIVVSDIAGGEADDQ
jgi:tRNA A37 threonylcarbamoyladenosine dehydratase